MEVDKATTPRDLKYNFKEVESRWQKRWQEQGLFRSPDVPDQAKKFYMLVMFAYPSGDIHMGHFRNYIIGDAIARRQMMLGRQVMHPFGWDAFGLPAERAAIKRGLNPSDWTEENIHVSRTTLQKVGISFEWEREVVTCHPDYYRWSQWLFLRLLERNLAYRKGGLVNWCPGCQTVLANEQVIQGRCDRCDSKVEKKELEQWYLRITSYADRLIDSLDTLSGWPDNLKTLQRDWIGRSEGAEIRFAVEGYNSVIPIFTTRLDTIFGASFIAVAPESALLKSLSLPSETAATVESYRQTALAKSEIDRSNDDIEKDGVFTGCYAMNPFNGARIPIWVADYVLAEYGTGAVMGVPGHDTRDHAFAKKYGLPITQVISPISGESITVDTEPYTEYGVTSNSGQFTGLTSPAAIKALALEAEQKGLGGPTKKFKLHDWLISRQRYWGTPIPVIHCPKCGIVPVPENQLPVLLPPVKDFLPKGRSPLADVPEFMNVNCPKCQSPAQRDADTMDTFICSSWYHLRYADPHNTEAIFASEKANAWLPIDKYVGGITHATGHLIYFRFITKVLFDMGLVNFEEPAREVFNHGMVMDSAGAVMSKSKGNVVSPIALMDERGVDVTRLAMYFTAPSQKEVLWSEAAVTGVEKFLLNKLLPLREFYSGASGERGRTFTKAAVDDDGWNLYVTLNQSINRVSDDYERLQFNTVISTVMELVRDLERTKTSSRQLKDHVVRCVIQLMAPLTPHICEELWSGLGESESIFRSSWPIVDPGAMQKSVVTIAVQIDGKVRGEVSIDPEASQQDVRASAMKIEKVQTQLAGRKIAKETYIRGRIYSFSTGAS